VAPNLQSALDAWDQVLPELCRLDGELEAGTRGEPLAIGQLMAPLPRAYEWIDGSAFISHIELVRKARGAALPPTLLSDPLIYQGGSGCLLGPHDPVTLEDPSHGLDFEAEVAVILGDTPKGTRVDAAQDCIKLVLLANDWTLRGLVPAELTKGFGFFVSKPATAFSPFALTPDELGSSFSNGRLYRPMHCYLNGQLVGTPDAGSEMHFSFFDLIAHATQTRCLTAGTLLGSGTVSNRDESRGFTCLAEKRAREVVASGSSQTEFLRPGDRVRIEMLDADGKNLFGSIEQRVV
jgi:fumarylacetoacetate (FAA) hydrolase